MKVIRFTTADSLNALFGVVVGDQPVSFTVLQTRAVKPWRRDSDHFRATRDSSVPFRRTGGQAAA